MSTEYMEFMEEFGEVFMDGASAGMVGVAAIIFAVIFLIAAAVGLIMYVLKGIGLFTIAKRRGLKLRGMAWVPVGSTWLMGSIADQYVRKAKGRDKRQRVLLLIGCIIVWILEIVSLVFTVIAVVDLFSNGGGLADLENLSTPMVSNILVSWATSMVTVAFYVFYYIALSRVYRSCAAGNCAWMLVLSIFFSTIAESIIIFSIRKKDAGFIELQRRAEEYTES